MANNQNAGEGKDKEALETTLDVTPDTLQSDAAILPEEPVLEQEAEMPSQEDALPVEEQVAQESAEGETLAEPLSVSDTPADQEEPLVVDFEEGEFKLAPDAEETTATPSEQEPVDAPAEQEPMAEPLSEEDAQAVAEAAAVDEIPVFAAPAEPTPEEEAPAAPAEEAPKQEGEGEDAPFVMDDEYLRAFMEEGAMDDYIYAGNYEERQDLLNKIADNAETLAEEGTEFLEQKAKEEEQKKKEEPRYNEKGELLDENGKVVLERTFANRLILADTRERRYYNKLKNEILSYVGVQSEIKADTEEFAMEGQVVARLCVAGYARIYYALDPEEFDVDRYKQANASQVDFEDTKMMLRVRDDDEFAIAVELLAIMMGTLNVNRAENPLTEDYLPSFPRREDAVLDKKGKYLSFEQKDEQAIIKEKRAEERRAAGIMEEEPEEVVFEEDIKEEPLVILPLTLENKIHQSTNTIKLLYSKLKNELLSYKTVKAELTIKNENFRASKRIVARMTIVADSIRLYLALDPMEYSTRKYKHRDASDQPGYEGTILMLKISSETERATASELITEMMKKYNILRNKNYAYVPYAEKYPYIKNGVFKGEEDKPRVKHEGEEYVDIYGELTEHLRSQMGSNDAWGVPKGFNAEDALTARDLLEIQRSKAKTMNAGVALATPIVFFYDAAINEAGEVQYLNVQQVLNDKFLGKMIPQEYFAIAEGSNRIEELNFIGLETVVKDCNEHPELRFALKISCRLLLKQETLTKLVDKMHTEHNNLILAFDCAMLEALGFAGISAINALKSQGALIMIDNAECASMRVLTEYEFDYLRLDARYYNGDSTKRLAHLDMITGYAKVQNILTTSINCEHKEEARILLDHGVNMIQGDAVARPMRLINLAITNLKPIQKVKKNGENG